MVSRGSLFGLRARTRPFLGQGGPEDEAAGFGGEDTIVIEILGGVGQRVHGGTKGGPVLHEGGYILEGDAFFGEVGDLPDVALYLF